MRNLNRKHVLWALGGAWLIFSTSYIAYDLWKDFQEHALAQAYERGRSESVSTVVKQAEKCMPFRVFADKKMVRLVNMDCQKPSLPPDGGAMASPLAEPTR